MTDRLSVVISLEATATAAEVLASLVAAGLEDADLQPVLGIVTGRVQPARLDALRTVEGVESVEASRDVHV